MRRGLVALMAPARPPARTSRRPADPGFVDRDCVDFAHPGQGPAVLRAQAAAPTQDPHLLDPDHDGIACETRPCPCLASGRGAGPGRGHQPRRRRSCTSPTATRSGSGAPAAPPFAVRLLGIDAPETKGPRECGVPGVGGQPRGAGPPRHPRRADGRPDPGRHRQVRPPAALRHPGRSRSRADAGARWVRRGLRLRPATVQQVRPVPPCRAQGRGRRAAATGRAAGPRTASQLRIRMVGGHAAAAVHLLDQLLERGEGDVLRHRAVRRARDAVLLLPVARRHARDADRGQPLRPERVDELRRSWSSLRIAGTNTTGAPASR